MGARRFAAVAAVLVLLGCSSDHEPDRDAWRSDLGTVLEIVNEDALGRLQEQWIERICTMSEEGVQLFVAAAADDHSAYSSPGLIRINAKHACPDRADEFEAAIAQMNWD